jgi:hypothetical protein
VPTLDEIDRIMTYCEEQQMFVPCLYHPPSVKIKPRAKRPSPVLWIMKEGKIVDYSQRKKDE